MSKPAKSGDKRPCPACGRPAPLDRRGHQLVWGRHTYRTRISPMQCPMAGEPYTAQE